MTQSIDIIFKLLNFFVLICTGWYIFNHYIIPMVAGHTKAYRQFKELLRLQKEELEAACEYLQDDLTSDKQYAISLEEKFDTWQQVLDKKADQDDVLYEKMCLQTQRKKEQQQVYIQQQKYIAEQLPEILAQVESQLQKKFESVSAQQMYIDSMVKKMEHERGNA